MESIDFRDVAIRALKTFVAAAIPAAATIPGLVESGNFSEIGAVAAAAALAGAAAVITFLWNTALQYSK